jgi:hypothetical protein
MATEVKIELAGVADLRINNSSWEFNWNFEAGSKQELIPKNNHAYQYELLP